MNGNSEYIFKKLKDLGAPVTRLIKTREPDLEDDTICVTSRVHIQVSSYGDGYAFVVRQCRDSYDHVFYPERLDLTLLCFDIRKALKEDV